MLMRSELTLIIIYSMYAWAHTHTDTHTLTHTHMHTHININIDTHTHLQTHTYTHTDTHTLGAVGSSNGVVGETKLGSSWGLGASRQGTLVLDAVRSLTLPTFFL